MPESTSTSFIPKRNPVKKVRRSATRPVFVGTLLIRAFFFAVLIATLVVFVYDNRLTSQLDQEIINLDNAIASFSEKDMQQVLDTNARLRQATDRLQYSASIASIFEALEVATIQTVQIERLELKREDDTEIDIVAKMKTGTFDSIIFQRGVLERDDKLVVSNVEDLVINNAADNKEGLGDNITSIGFRANLSISTESIPHKIVTGNQIRNASITNTQSAPTAETVTDNTDADDTTTTDEADDVIEEDEAESDNQDDI